MCSKGFVAGAAVLGSCGCLFHNTCVAEMIESKCHRCLFCDTDLDASWVAQWGGQLTPEQDRWMEQTVDLVKRVGAMYPPAARNQMKSWFTLYAEAQIRTLSYFQSPFIPELTFYLLLCVRRMKPPRTLSMHILCLNWLLLNFPWKLVTSDSVISLSQWSLPLPGLQIARCA